jgi:enoyl-CoA hydratase/carnithine racemase
VTVRPPELETIEILLDGGVATVLLNRPRERNAWTLRMSEDMSAALAWCDRTDAVGGVVVSGNGPHFCVGADLSGRDILHPGGEPDREPPAPRQVLWPSAVRKPVVAALHGHAVGIGMTFSARCPSTIPEVSDEPGSRPDRRLRADRRQARTVGRHARSADPYG